MPEPGPLAALFGRGDAARLDRCAVLLRLAEDLERSRDQLVRAHHASRSAAQRRAATVELRLIADGEPAVPRWAASRESELFARAFHRDLLRSPPERSQPVARQRARRHPRRSRARLAQRAQRASSRRSRTAAARSGMTGGGLPGASGRRCAAGAQHGARWRALPPAFGVGAAEHARSAPRRAPPAARGRRRRAPGRCRCSRPARPRHSPAGSSARPCRRPRSAASQREPGCARRRRRAAPWSTRRSCGSTPSRRRRAAACGPAAGNVPSTGTPRWWRRRPRGRPAAGRA